MTRQPVGGRSSDQKSDGRTWKRLARAVSMGTGADSEDVAAGVDVVEGLAAAASEPVGHLVDAAVLSLERLLPLPLRERMERATLGEMRPEYMEILYSRQNILLRQKRISFFSKSTDRKLLRF